MKPKDGGAALKVWSTEDVDGRVRQHVISPIGSDSTLCGFTLDSDDLVVARPPIEKEGRVTCEDCKAIIRYCQSLKESKNA